MKKKKILTFTELNFDYIIAIAIICLLGFSKVSSFFPSQIMKLGNGYVLLCLKLGFGNYCSLLNQLAQLCDNYFNHISCHVLINLVIVC